MYEEQSIKKMAKAVFEVENRRRITERPKPPTVSVYDCPGGVRSSVHRDIIQPRPFLFIDSARTPSCCRFLWRDGNIK